MQVYIPYGAPLGNWGGLVDDQDDPQHKLQTYYWAKLSKNMGIFSLNKLKPMYVTPLLVSTCLPQLPNGAT